MILTPDAEAELQSRINIGRDCLVEAWGSVPHEDDQISAATDAISDIITAVVGPAGVALDGRLTYNEHALTEARQLVESALISYFGDVEDYDAIDDEPKQESIFNALGGTSVLPVPQA